MPPELTIRRAVREDADAILHLIHALAEFEQLPPPDQAAQGRLIADAFAAQPRFEVWLADLGGQIVGYAFLFETYSTFLALPTLYLEDLFVLPEHRSRRIGYALFRQCVLEAVRRGCGRMEWQVLDWNTNAIQFYERFGAQQMGEWLSYRLTASELAHIAAQGA
jgi:GNAT superfamily N-acetyltransferase